jgi:hypothetical protein
MSQAIKTQIENIAAQAGVKFSALYRGEKRKALGEAQTMDEWSCAFTKGDGREAHEEFKFFTGLGLRKPNQSSMAKSSAASLAKVSKRMLAWEHHHKQWPDMPQAPHMADVLHSLILDAGAVGQSFDSWCDDLGYDADSRKAFNIYEACQRNADKLARIFSAAQREALSEALQDY